VSDEKFYFVIYC